MNANIRELRIPPLTLKVTSPCLQNSVELNAMWYSRLDAEQEKKKASVGKLEEIQIMSMV